MPEAEDSASFEPDCWSEIHPFSTNTAAADYSCTDRPTEGFADPEAVRRELELQKGGLVARSAAASVHACRKTDRNYFLRNSDCRNLRTLASSLKVKRL